nr:hypothetical protein [Bacteroidaceae bacterium]
MDLRKLLCFAAVAAMGGSTWAQKDVTSTYITNPSFEGSISVYQNPRSDRAIYQPEGWTVSYSNGNEWDMTALNKDESNWGNFSNRAKLSEVESNCGSNTYWVRYRWGKNVNITLSQDITLLAGSYSLNFYGYLNSSSATATVSVAGQST